jgi:hypothetical protein
VILLHAALQGRQAVAGHHPLGNLELRGTVKAVVLVPILPHTLHWRVVDHRAPVEHGRPVILHTYEAVANQSTTTVRFASLKTTRIQRVTRVGSTARRLVVEVAILDPEGAGNLTLPTFLLSLRGFVNKCRRSSSLGTDRLANSPVGFVLLDGSGVGLCLRLGNGGIPGGLDRAHLSDTLGPQSLLGFDVVNLDNDILNL